MTRITSENVSYIRDNSHIPASQLSEVTGLSEKLVQLIIEVADNGCYRGKEGNNGISSFRQKIIESENLLTMQQAAQRLDMPETSIWEKFSSGEIRAKKIQGAWVTRKQDLVEYMEADYN